MGFSLVAVCGLLIAVVSLVSEHRLWGAQTSVGAARGLSSCDWQALEHRLNHCSVAREILDPDRYTRGFWESRGGACPVAGGNLEQCHRQTYT